MKNQKVYNLESNPRAIAGEIAQLAKIPSHPAREGEKIKFLHRTINDINILCKLHIDKRNNLTGFVQGTGHKTLLFVSHVDAANTFESPITIIADKLFGQNVFNNSYANLALVKLLDFIKINGVQPEVTTHFLWSAGSQGDDTYRGIKYFLDHHPEIDAIVNLDALNLGELSVECPGLYKAIIEIESSRHTIIFDNLQTAIEHLEKSMKYRVTINLQESERSLGHATLQIAGTRILDYGRACHEIHKYIHRIAHTYNLVVHIKTIYNSPPSQMKRNNPLLQTIKKLHSAQRINTHYISYNSDADFGLFENIPTVSMGLALGSRPLTQPEYLMMRSLSEGFNHLFTLYTFLQSSNAIG
jgi:hypothetical protein